MELPHIILLLTLFLAVYANITIISPNEQTIWEFGKENIVEWKIDEKTEEKITSIYLFYTSANNIKLGKLSGSSFIKKNVIITDKTAKFDLTNIDKSQFPSSAKRYFIRFGDFDGTYSPLFTIEGGTLQNHNTRRENGEEGSNGNDFTQTENSDTANIGTKKLPNCSEKYNGLTFNNQNCNGNNPTKYCLNNDGIIYGVSDDGNTCVQISDGTYVFSVSENAILVKSDTTISDDDSLVMYQCSMTQDNDNNLIKKCNKTAGFAIIKSYYYEIPYSDNSVSKKISTSNLRTNCYTYDNNIRMVGNLVNFSGNINVCYRESSNKSIKFPNSEDENKTYFMIDYGTYDKINNGPFTGINTSNKSESGIAVSTSYQSENNPTMMYFDSFYSETNYCNDYNSGELLERKAYICKYNGNSCTYYYCTNGICKRSENTCPRENVNECLPSDEDAQTNCDDGYYIVTGYGNSEDTNEGGYEILATNDIQNGYLYNCKDKLCERMDNMYGFFKNSDKKSEATYPYIKCVYSNYYGYGGNRLCTLTQSPTATSCVSAGDFIKDIDGIDKLCITSEKSVPIVSEKVSFEFTSSLVLRLNYSSDNTILVLDKDSVHTISRNMSNEYNENIDDYFLIDSSSGDVITQPNRSGIIYSCYMFNCYYIEGSRIGYLLNAPYRYDSNVAQYIRCSDQNNDQNNCSTISVTYTKCSDEDDNSARGGELFKTIETIDNKETEVINLCLDTTNGQSISIPLKDNYSFYNNDNDSVDYDYYYDGNYDDYYKLNYLNVMVSTNTPNVFGYNKDKYLMVEIDRKNVLYYSSSYLYRHTFENYIVIEYGRLSYSNICMRPDDIIEFELICAYDEEFDSSKNYYRKL